MDRQKVTIKPKPSPIIKEKGTAASTATSSTLAAPTALPAKAEKSSVSKLVIQPAPVPAPTSTSTSKPAEVIPGRVYTVGSGSKKCVSNNIIQLQLYLVDIKSIENTLNVTSKNLLSSIDDKPIVPKAWNEPDRMNGITSTTETEPNIAPPVRKDPFKALIKRTTVEFKDDNSSAETVSRKDLIINSGVKRQAKQLLQVFATEWPVHSPYACWTDCHPFSTTPVGIPHSLIDGKFYCYGNFCSYNCAKRYLCPNADDDDDMAMMQTIHDIFIRDDKSEKLQLLELLCHIETGTPLDEPIRISPKRIALKLFGGDKTIEEYRSNFSKNTTYHVFKSPLVPISYQMEECSNKGDTRKKTRAVSLDTLKIQKAFDSLMQEKEKNNTVLRKLLKSGGKSEAY